MKGKAKTKCFYWSEEMDEVLEEVRQLLIKMDRIKYGKKFVKNELQNRKGRYTDTAIMKFIIEQVPRTILKELQLEYETLKTKKEKQKERDRKSQTDPLTKIVLTLTDSPYWIKKEV